MKLSKLLKQKLLNDEIVKDSFSEEDIERIAKVLEEFLSSETIDEEVCYNFYKEMKLPYSIVYRSFGLIKEEIKVCRTIRCLSNRSYISIIVWIGCIGCISIKR